MLWFILQRKAAVSSQSCSGEYMWEINNGFQALSFLYSIIIGIILAVFYDILKAIRISFKISDFAVFLTDIIYYIISAVASFCFFLSVSDGEIRFYILFGFVIGFLIWRITVSKFFIIILKYLFSLIFKINKFLSDKIYGFFDAFFSFTVGISKKAIIFLKNSENTLKKLLKKTKDMLYTKQE